MKRMLPRRLLGAMFAGALLLNTPARAQETNTLELIKQLQRRIEELERKVQSLQEAKPATEAPTNTSGHLEASDQNGRVQDRTKELEKEAIETKASEAPQITLGERGFSFASGDTNFLVRLQGVLQMDSKTFFGDSIVGNDSLLLRRARPILSGTVFHDFDFLFVPDFAPSTPQIMDAYINYRFRPELQFRLGKFKTPVGLENLQADQVTMFNERAFPSQLVPGRDVGFQVHGEVAGGVLAYAAGIFNGVGDNRNSSNVDFDDNKAFAGRVFVHPFRRSATAALQGLGFGLGGSYESIQGTNASALASGYLTPGQQTFFLYNPTNRAAVVPDGEHWRLAPQAYYYYGPFSLVGEYTISSQRVRRVGAEPLVGDTLQHSAWQVAAGWVLTGEDASYAGGVVPRRSFNPHQGGWGAWQLVGRYSELNLDPASLPLFANDQNSARSAHEWAVGLNWYLNRNLRVATSYSQTSFRGGGSTEAGGPGPVTHQDERVLFTRVQLAF